MLIEKALINLPPRKCRVLGRARAAAGAAVLWDPVADSIPVPLFLARFALANTFSAPRKSWRKPRFNEPDWLLSPLRPRGVWARKRNAARRRHVDPS